MSSSNCCFLTCILISQEAGKVVCYSHLLKKFPQFVVFHTIKGFGVVNKAEVGAFLELSCFFLMIQRMLAIWSLVLLPFLNQVWTSGSSWLTYCWSLAWRILNITLLEWQLLWQSFIDKPQMGKTSQRIWSKIEVRLIPSHHFRIRLKGKAWVEHILQFLPLTGRCSYSRYFPRS